MYKYCPPFSKEVSYLQNNWIFNYLGEERVKRTISNQDVSYGSGKNKPLDACGILCESNTVHETRLYSGLPTTTANQPTIKKTIKQNKKETQKTKKPQ